MREVTRRDCLRTGVALGCSGALLGLPGSRLLAGADEPPSPERGLPFRYLESGLAALAGIKSADQWSNGHYGASVIAAWFFAKELDLDQATLQALASELDAFQSNGKEFFAAEAPQEEAVPDRVEEIVRSIELGIDGLHGVGHGAIFSTLALKAFRHAPVLAKPRWIDGVLALDRFIRERFRPEPESGYNRAHPLPSFQTPQ
jgi:hypothetical protein